MSDITWLFIVPFDGSEKICKRCLNHKPFADHAGIVRHLRNIHNITSVLFACRFCNETYSRLKDTRSHIKKLHANTTMPPAPAKVSQPVQQPHPPIYATRSTVIISTIPSMMSSKEPASSVSSTSITPITAHSLTALRLHHQYS